MKVLALTEGREHVCCRYRITAFRDALAQEGADLEVLALRKSTTSRLGQLRAARNADIVILQRKLLPLWQLLLLRRWSKRLIYDVDDAVFQRDSYSDKAPSSWRRTGRFWATLQACDSVLVGNDYLQKFARGFIETERVHRVPTCLDPNRYTPVQHSRSDSGVRLAWIGQASTLHSLNRASAQLQASKEHVPGLQLKVICDRSIELESLEVTFRRWSTDTEAAELAGTDIGINWLPDDSWSRGKCGLRVLQYMAAGLPVVANPVGTNREMVLHGRTGFLASTPTEWAQAIAELAANPALRQRMGQAGRQWVNEHYDVSLWGPRFARLVVRNDSLCDAPQCRDSIVLSHPASPQHEKSKVRIFGHSQISKS